MLSRSSVRRALIGAAMGIVACATPVLAQQPSPASGPLVLQPIRPATVFGIDAKAAQVNGGTGTFAGGYVGRLFDESIFIGGAGYGLTSRVRGVEMGYGGVVLGIQTSVRNPVSVGVRTLFGFGEASLGETVAFVYPLGPYGQPGLPPSSHLARYRSDFSVAEPEIFLQLQVNQRVQVNLGGGYRAIGDARGLEQTLRGATAHIALQFTLGG